VPGLIEVVTRETARPRGRHESLAASGGGVAIRAWNGARPDREPSGAGWQLGDRFMPYMQPNFVTPPFHGYTSGHSVFSRAAAEVLAEATGTPFFPGGLATFVVPAGGLGLVEAGPGDILRRGRSGGARPTARRHPSLYDDYPSRITGARIGSKAWAKARRLYGDGPSQPVTGPEPR
jgi:hypothetical protein